MSASRDPFFLLGNDVSLLAKPSDTRRPCFHFSLLNVAVVLHIVISLENL